MRGEIQGDNLVFMSDYRPKGLFERLLHRLFEKIFDERKTYPLNRLSEHFSHITDVLNGNMVYVHYNEREEDGRPHDLILNISVSDIFNHSSGFIRAQTFECTFPFGLDNEKRKEYQRQALNLAASGHGESREGGFLTVVLGDAFKNGSVRATANVMIGEAMIAMDAVEKVVDQGKYREIFFYRDTGREHRMTVCTPESCEALDAKFEI